MPAPISFGACRFEVRPQLFSPHGFKPAQAGPISDLRVTGKGGGNVAAGAGTIGESLVLALAALMLVAASPSPAEALASSSPWWEKFTFTMSADGVQQACNYEASTAIPGARGCDSSSDRSSLQHKARASSGTYTKITFERLFTPGTEPTRVSLETGDTLLGGELMALAIDGNGKVNKCEIVGASGEMKPPYGCDEALLEKFEAAAGSGQARRGFMTVLVYGHEEYPV
jgi:hypothetical protein